MIVLYANFVEPVWAGFSEKPFFLAVGELITSGNLVFWLSFLTVLVLFVTSLYLFVGFVIDRHLNPKMPKGAYILVGGKHTRRGRTWIAGELIRPTDDELKSFRDKLKTIDELKDGWKCVNQLTAENERLKTEKVKAVLDSNFRFIENRSFKLNPNDRRMAQVRYLELRVPLWDG